MSGSSETVARRSVGLLAAKLAPSCHKVVVAVENQADFPAGHGMFCGEVLTTTITLGRESSRL